MKVNKYSIIACSSAVLMFATGCKDSFLEQEPNGVISTEQLQKEATWNPDIMLGQALGTYATTFAWKTGGTDDHDDFGQKSIDITTDIMSGDMALSGKTYGWFGDDADLVSSVYTHNRAYKIWRYYYRIIKACNEILDTVGGDEQAPENEENAAFYAQAKALRAHAYFNLVNLYARPYLENKDAKAIPLYRSQLTAETAGLSTVAEVYELIIKDVKDAIAILEENQNIPVGKADSQINVWIAKGILSYIYLMKGDYADAANLSKDIITNSPYKLMDHKEIVETGFTTVSIPGWMWGYDITKDNTAGLPTFWGQVDYFTYSYCSAGDMKMIDANLYSQIPDSDIRKQWFHPTALISWSKFYDLGRVPMGDRQWLNDIVYMRVAEMYMINAEANVRNNNLPAAQETLAAFLTERDEERVAEINTLSATELLEEIYYNWRVEFWAEGRGLLTMKRFQKSMVRGANNVSFAGEEISYDDPRLTFAIPEREITNNPNLAK